MADPLSLSTPSYLNSDMETVDEFRPFDLLPPEVILSIFLDPIFTLQETARLALVCKNWKELAFDEAVGKKYLFILQACFLIPTNPSLLERGSWALLKDVYYSKCEVYLDISESMREKIESEEEEETKPLCKRALLKTLEVIHSALSFIKQVAFFTFDENVSKSQVFKRSDFLQNPVALEKPNCIGATDLTFLSIKLNNFAKEGRHTANRLKTVFVISDLEIPSREEILTLMDTIKEKHTVLSSRNVNFVFVEIKTKKHKDVLKRKLNALIMEKHISWIRIQEMPLIEAAAQTTHTPKKRVKTEDS